MIGNPILDEIDQAHQTLSPPAQRAIHMGLSGLPVPVQEAAQQPQQSPATLASPPVARGGLEPMAQAGPLVRPMAMPSQAKPLASDPVRTDPRYESALAQHDTLARGSGISQIHNPFLRALGHVGEIAGSLVAPGIMPVVPGTEAHHQMLVRENDANLAGMEQRANEETNRQHLGAETDELPARAAHEQAQANALNHPQPKDLFELWHTQNPNGTADDWAKFQDEHRPASTDFETWAKQNPGKPVSEWLKLKGENAHTPVQPFEEWRKANPQAPVSDWLKLEQSMKPGAHGEYEDYRAAYMKNHPGSDDEAVVKEYAKAHQAPQQPPHALMVGPDGKAIDVTPGATVPQGAMTPGGVNSTNVPTAQTRTMAETAPKVLELATRVGQLIDQQTQSLGPAASRWNEFMAGRVGAPNAEFTKLRTDVGLLQTALMRMHVGARGGEQMMEHFRSLIDVAKQSPENLKAALGEIQEYAKQVASEGHRSEPQGQSAPQGKVRKYNPATGKLDP